MSETLLKTLSATMNRIVGPEGRFTSNAHAAKETGVTRSTIDRLRNADNPGASKVGIDKLSALCEGLGVEPWQLFVPGMSLDRPPKLEGIKRDEKEIELLEIFHRLGDPEKTYLILKAKEMLLGQEGATRSKSA